MRKILGISLIVLGILSILYCFGALSYRVSFGLFFGLFGAVLIAVGFFIRNADEKYLRYAGKLPFKIFISIIVLLLISFIVIESLIIYHGSREDNVKVDYLVVLGAGLWGDVPSLTLKQRLDESLDFIRQNPDTKIVLSGGMGPGETITEAEGMKRYLVGKGVDEKIIIKEEKSTNTKENLKFTRDLLKKSDGRENIKIKIVTSDFHMFRSKLIARNKGFIVFGKPSPTHPMLIPAYYVREFMAVIKTLIFDIK